jgi:hypothetical protein
MVFDIKTYGNVVHIVVCCELVYFCYSSQFIYNFLNNILRTAISKIFTLMWSLSPESETFE